MHAPIEGGPAASPAHQTELAPRQLMVRVTVVLCMTVPDVPLKVRVRLPVFAPPPTVMVTVACFLRMRRIFNTPAAHARLLGYYPPFVGPGEVSATGQKVAREVARKQIRTHRILMNLQIAFVLLGFVARPGGLELPTFWFVVKF